MISLLIPALLQAQSDSVSAAYAQKWHGTQSTQNAFIQMMASHNLIFIVLGVSLIIWFVLLFFIIRTDRKISKLEKKVNKKAEEVNYEA